MKHISREHLLLAAVLAAGLILRVWGLGFGLPFQFHQDEPIVINHAVAYGTGDLNPHFFIIPPFCSYILFVLYALYYLAGSALGTFAGTQDFALGYFSDPTAFYIIARTALGIAPGMLMIWFTYALYKRLFGQRGAVYAAAAVAVSFLCVINAHYAYVDNVMVMLALALYVSLVKLIERPDMKSYVTSAVILGLAVSTKYNGALLAVSCYTAHAIAVFREGGGKRRLIFDGKLWFAVLIPVLVFVITNPFSVLDWRFFLESVPGKIRARHMGWLHHAGYSLAQGAGWPLLAAGVAGALAVFLKEKKDKAVLFVSFPLVFYMHLALGSQRFSRYGLPLVPFLAMGAAFLFFGWLMPASKKNWQRYAVIITAAAVLFPTAVKSVKADLLFSSNDTRVASKEWIEARVPPLTGIAVDHTSFRPQILQSREQIERKRDIAYTPDQEGLKGAKEKKIDLLARAVEGKRTYNVYFLTYEEEKRGQFLSTVPAIGYDIDELKSEGISYVVVDYNTIAPEKTEFIRDLNDKADVAAVFSPYYDGEVRERFDRTDTTAVSIGARELFSRKAEGPVLVIYKLRYEQ